MHEDVSCGSHLFWLLQHYWGFRYERHWTGIHVMWAWYPNWAIGVPGVLYLQLLCTLCCFDLPQNCTSSLSHYSSGMPCSGPGGRAVTEAGAATAAATATCSPARAATGGKMSGVWPVPCPCAQSTLKWNAVGGGMTGAMSEAGSQDQGSVIINPARPDPSRAMPLHHSLPCLFALNFSLSKYAISVLGSCSNAEAQSDTSLLLFF